MRRSSYATKHHMVAKSGRGLGLRPGGFKRPPPRAPSHSRDRTAEGPTPDYARDLNPSEIWVQKKSRSSLI